MLNHLKSNNMKTILLAKKNGDTCSTIHLRVLRHSCVSVSTKEIVLDFLIDRCCNLFCKSDLIKT